ncbi:uncharacterized protein ATC70_001937 [Mucor velutinosus]|uniref:Uncharacterized protein n=1 Tax=Mucor velutinosus TaxID=708070 RepID=A0AAN7DCB6_9FUNG|nr:hypothetical protein ATC70_001937 [Mucor velutinosus]
MKQSIKFINALRFFTLLFSLIGLGCHFAQCTLLHVYQNKTNIPSWISVGHWQYLAWYILFSLSVMSALAVCVHATCCKRGHILRGDKCLGSVNIAVSAVIIIAITFWGGQEPWTHGLVEFKEPAKGFITYCAMLDQDHDATYPLLMQRCLLVDSTYVVSIAVSLMWIVLVISSSMIKSSRRMSDPIVPILSNEHEKGRWKISLASNKRASTAKKYATPIAPQREKLELPGSYDHRNSNDLSRLQVDRYSMLARQYPPPNASNALPGAYVSPAHTPSPFYYS